MKWLLQYCKIAILHTDFFVGSAQQKSMLIKPWITFRCFHTKCIQLPLFPQPIQQDSVLGVNLCANHLYVHISAYHRQRIILRGVSGGGGDGGVLTGEKVCRPEITVRKPNTAGYFSGKFWTPSVVFLVQKQVFKAKPWWFPDSNQVFCV